MVLGAGGAKTDMTTSSTAQNLRMIDAARLLGVSDPEKFRLLAKRAGVSGSRHKSGRVLWSDADVEVVRRYVEASGIRLEPLPPR
jgi:predicted DNA-binding transcriptional regulator AlpA